MTTSTVNTTDKLLWKPNAEKQYEINLFINYVNQRFGKNIDNYFDLHKWSCDELEDFWVAVWDYCGIISHAPYTQVLDKTVQMSDVPSWFSGSLINYAENLLEKYADNDKIAIYTRGEQFHQDITYRELYNLVKKAAYSMRKLGLKKGDRVVSYTTNCLEAVVGMLATASIGAIWSSSSVDFGVTAVTDRFSQIEPKMFISIDQSLYNGKTFNHIEKINKIKESLPTVEHVIIIQTNKSLGNISDLIKDSISWESLIEMGESATKLEYELVSFDHPLYILFSSGTTGKPKCLVHRTGGILINHLKEHKIILGIGYDDVYFYYTTTGWMMWNYLVGGLAVGSSIILYEGTPLGPTPGVLWDLADDLNITVFGTSAKYIQHLEDVGYYPMDHHSLTYIRTILSTASPLKPNSYEFVYSHVKSDVLLDSISGGTDICSVFVGGCHILPVYKGEISCPLLGLAVECWDAEGNQITDKSGDLVCVKPFPCMPIYFWGDSSDKSRYKNAYFNKFQNVWCQGDFMKVNSVTKGILMLGRSDGTLNPNGIRFGSAEIYNIADHFEEVEDSLVVGQQIDQNERVILFLKLRNKNVDFSDLKTRINSRIRAELSPRHVPAKVIVVEKVPYTTNGKKIEVAVKLLLNNMYSMAQSYLKDKKITFPDTKVQEETANYVRGKYVFDEKTIQTCSDHDAIFQFIRIDELMF
ncbi:hypothetical protein BB558_002502 [Smittium angustum]|uniref:AMP-dependent synthetase/ligase domain-containing protein n=1 Tax=Smittium angustum TaxID=133377 RepID=A0A2U1J8U6_SMIAN|nr:hypothetical protein BB558_002502 [Smittium angustum]